MNIQVNQVEGQTVRKGTKQNRVYNNLVESSVNGFFTAETGESIWNVKGDWSLIGIQKKSQGRYSYTDNFQILN
jgi:hypothetical protein